MGLADFLCSDGCIDCICGDPNAFFSYQRASLLESLSSEFWGRFGAAVTNLLRRDAKLSRQRSLALSRAFCQRGQCLESIYIEGFSEAARLNEDAAHGLMRVRGKLRAHCGLTETPPGIKLVLYSEIRHAVASSLEHFITHIGPSHDFWSACTPFLCVDGAGRCCGRYKYDGGMREFRREAFSAPAAPVEFRTIVARVAAGTAVPTTPTLYALLHLAGGISHYGNSCSMNQWLAAVLGISRPYVDITQDGTNSFAVGTIEARVRRRQLVLRNVSADLLWHCPNTYRRHIDEAVSTGRPAYSHSFARDVPDDVDIDCGLADR
jgi:hypothetical protein